jgi:hypothetical protein
LPRPAFAYYLHVWKTAIRAIHSYSSPRRQHNVELAAVFAATILPQATLDADCRQRFRNPTEFAAKPCCVLGPLAQTSKPTEAIQVIASAMAGMRAIGATIWITSWSCHLALAHAELASFDDAWRSLGEATEAVETTKEGWYQAEINRVVGEIALKSPEPDAVKAEAYFEHALTVARAQNAKSWELRGATSMARLWRDQGNRDEARK